MRRRRRSSFVKDGFLVRERLFEAHLERLRSALDEVVAAEYGEFGRRSAVQSSRQYGGRTCGI